MSARARSTPKQHPDERFSISAGSLGPIGASTINILPLTVLVGRQGTGKSLVAQMLYFFRGLPSLVRYDTASRRPDGAEDTPRKAIRRIIDGMRSSHRSFARLTVPNVSIQWQGVLAANGIHAHQHELGFNVQSATSQITPKKIARGSRGSDPRVGARTSAHRRLRAH